MAEAASILDEVAREDFAALEPGPDGASFAARVARAVASAAGAGVALVAGRQWRAHAFARMRDLLRQLRGLHSLGHDRQLRVEQAGHAIRCHRGRVWLERR